MVLDDGYAWNGCVYRSLSQVAKAITGTNWNGHRFFGLKAVRNGAPNRKRSARTAILPARPRKPRRATPLILRAKLATAKPRLRRLHLVVRFAGTAWWRTQSGETGLRDRARLGNREKHTVDGCYCFFWGVQNGGGCAFPSG